MSALSDPENVWLEEVVEPERRDESGLTEDQVYAYLSQQSGGSGNVAVTAAGENIDGIEHDYTALGMIALVPSQVDIERLVVPGGELPDDIHLNVTEIF